MKRHVEGLRGSPLRFSLLSDCLALAHPHGTYGPQERAEIRGLARSLDVAED